MIDFDTYQELAHKTAVYPQEYGVFYAALGLAGEAGELANKIKKYMIRDRAEGGLTEEQRKALLEEVGDMLWYAAELLTVLGVKMGDVAEMNIEKLADRAKRGALHGSGDKR